MNYVRALILNLPFSIYPSPILKGKFSLKVLWILTLFFTFYLTIITVVQINAYIREVYLLQDYGNQIDQLTKENKILEINLSKDNSLNNINNYVQNFEKAEQVDYIKVLDSTVVAK